MEKGMSVTEPGAVMQSSERAALGIVGGMILASGLSQRGPVRAMLLLLGGGLGLMAAQGRNQIATALKIQSDESGEIQVREAVTIKAPADTLYAQWRDLKNLPKIMSHLERIELLDAAGQRSHWTAKAPAPLGEVSWDAEICADEPGKRLAWRSLSGSQIENHGEVCFRAAPGDRGTEVVAHLSYRPSGGTVGAVIARIMGEEPAQQLRDDLMRFKREQELGYIPTTEGQTSGRTNKGDKA